MLMMKNTFFAARVAKTAFISNSCGRSNEVSTLKLPNIKFSDENLEILVYVL